MLAVQQHFDEDLQRAWPLNLPAFAREVSGLLTNPPGPAGDAAEPIETSLAFYLDPLGTNASVDILGVMLLLKSIVRRTTQTSDRDWATGLVESVYSLLFDLPTCNTKDVPLLQKEEEREEAYSLLEALAGSSKDAFALLGRRLVELHGTSTSEFPLAHRRMLCYLTA